MDRPTSVMDLAFHVDSVLDVIIKNVSNFEQFLELRLINKAFNEACIRKLHASYQKILIETETTVFPEEWHYDPSEHIFVNGFDLKLSANPAQNEFLKFCRFLTNAVTVKVSSLEIRNLYGLGKQFRPDVHSIIHEVLITCEDIALTEFIGMEQLCPGGCPRCTNLARRCKKYGPVQIHAFYTGFENWPKHYEELHISDRLLHHIARLSIICARVNAHSHMKTIIPPVSCSHLVLSISEPKPNTQNAQGLPRKALEEILYIWRPHSIGIVVNRWDGFEIQEYPVEFFMEFKLDAPMDPFGNSMTFDTVKVDLSNSTIQELNENLVPNVKGMFSTDKISMIFPRNCMKFSDMSENIQRLLKQPWQNTNPAEIRIELFPKLPNNHQHCHFSDVTSIQRNQILNIHVETEQLKLHNWKTSGIDCYDRKEFKKVEFIGKKLSIHNQNSSFSMTIWMEKVEFEEYFHTLTSLWRNDLWFTKQFIDRRRLVNCEICQGLVRNDERIWEDEEGWEIGEWEVDDAADGVEEMEIDDDF